MIRLRLRDISDSIIAAQGNDERRIELAEQLLLIAANSLGQAVDAQEDSPAAGVDEYAALQNLIAGGASDDTLQVAALALVDALLADLVTSTQNIEANIVAPATFNDLTAQSQVITVFDYLYDTLEELRPDEGAEALIADFESLSSEVAFIERVIFELTNETARQLGRENLFATPEDVSGAFIALDSNAELQSLISELSLILSPSNQEQPLVRDALREQILNGETEEGNLQYIKEELDEFTVALYETTVDLIEEHDVQARTDAVLRQALDGLSVDASLVSRLLNDVASVLGPQVQTEQRQRVDENTSNYLAFLENNDLLTAVEALKRAESGADIKQVARDVGVQGYLSLIDSDALSLLKRDVYDSLDALQNSVSLDIAAHQEKVAGLNSNVRTNLTGLTDLLEGDDAGYNTAAQDALAEIDTAYSEDVDTIQQAYLDALAANEAKYGDKLTTRERRTKRVKRSGGKSGRGSYSTKTYYVTVPNAEYVALKDAADQHAGAERVAAIDTATTQSELDKAYVQASYIDPDIARQIAELSADFDASIGAFKDEKTILFNSLNSIITDITRKIELVTEQEIIEDQLRGEFIAEGTVEEGEKSLASALTAQEFGELNQIAEISVDSDGVVKNARYIQEVSIASIDFASSSLGDGIAARDKAKGTGYILYVDGSVDTRFSGAHRDNAEQFIAVTYDAEKEQWYYDNNNKLVAFIPQSGDQLVASVSFSADTVELLDGVDAIIDGIPAGYIDSDLSIRANRFDGESNKGEFSVSLSYLDFKEYNTVLSSDKNDLLFSDKEEQDRFLEATDWRFAASQGYASPRNHLLSQADLNINAEDGGVLLASGNFNAFGQLGVSATGGINTRSANLSGGLINLTSGGDVTGTAVTLDAVSDVNVYAVGALGLSSLARSYRLSSRDDTVIGTLAAKDWDVKSDQRLVSHELSAITAGGDLSLNSLGDLTLAAVSADVSGDVNLSTGTNLNLSAERSSVEYHEGGKKNGSDSLDIRSHVTDITSGGNFSARAGDSATFIGTQIDAGGTLSLNATNDLTLSAAQDVYQYERRKSSSSLFSKKSSRKSKTRVTHQGTSLAADGNLDIESELGNLTTAGSEFISRRGNINLSATEGNIFAGAFTDINRSESEKSSSSFFGFIGSTTVEFEEYRNATGTAILADLDLELVSGEDTTLVGAQLSAGRDLNLNVGGDLHVLAAIDSERKEFFESKLGAVFATTVIERSHKETAVLTTINANGEISFSIGGETYLTLYGYEGEERQSAAELYPEELLALANLILLDETLLDEYFYDETKSLSPAFIAAVTIAATWGYGYLLTGPLASSAFSAGLVTATTGGTLTATGTAVAGFAASATLGIANGTVSGDLDLGQILQSAAISAGTSYLTASINLGIAGDETGAATTATSAEKVSAFGEALRDFEIGLGFNFQGLGLSTELFGGAGNLNLGSVLEGAFDGAISSGINSAVYGTDFGEGLSSSLIRTVVALGLADVQTGIGSIFNDANGRPINGGEGSIGHVLLHGLAGCAAAEAGGADCRAGAAAGVSQAIYSGYLSSEGTTLNDAQQQERARLIGALIGYAVSGGEAENVSVAASIAQSGIENNRQLHRRLEELLSERLGIEVTDALLDDTAALDALTSDQRALLARACAIERCYLHLSLDDPNWAGRFALAKLYSENANSFDALWDATIGSVNNLGVYRDFALENGYGSSDALDDIEAAGIVNIPSSFERLLYLALSVPNSGDAILLDPSVFNAFTIAATQATDPNQIYSALETTIPNELRSYLNTVTASAVEDLLDPLSLLEARLRGLRTLDGLEEGTRSDLVPDVPEGVLYFRVQGGQGPRPGQTSQERLLVNPDGTVSINPGCSGQLCVSVEGPDHAAYYISNNRPNGEVVVFEVDLATHNRIMEARVPQAGNGGSPVQEVDPNVPEGSRSTSLQLDQAYAELIANGSSNGRVLTQQEFFDEFGLN